MRTEQKLQTELLRVIVGRQNVQVDEDLAELPDEVDLPLRSVDQINNMERLLSDRNIQRIMVSAKYRVHTWVRTHEVCADNLQFQ